MTELLIVGCIVGGLATFVLLVFLFSGLFRSLYTVPPRKDIHQLLQDWQKPTTQRGPGKPLVSQRPTNRSKGDNQYERALL